ncbi:hypothetical protein ACFVUS_15285 [Nocardia sp. NPDC058058]|uniref:hypothetical protein n=1 Tax=Nocardia sp. NPDC058058 TaxID=3346317 RepID=UPI0036DC8826
MPDIRRFDGVLQPASAFFGAVVAGLLLMAPLDLGWSNDAPLELDLLVMNMPRAAAAGGMFAVIAAALAVALGRRTAWIVSFGSAAVLAADHLWNMRSALSGTLITVNYIDAIFGGILLGALAVAVFGKPIATGAYLLGAVVSITVGDLTALPAPGAESRTLIEWASSGTPPLWMILATVVLLALGALGERVDPAADPAENADLPIGPILAALLLVGATAFSTDWYVRHADTFAQTALAVGVTVLAALGAALLLPGRDGVLVLLAVAVTNSGSSIFTVPRPDWSAPLPIIAVAIGWYAGRRAHLPWAVFAGTGALAVFASTTAGSAHHAILIPLIGITGLGFLMGYCFAGHTPRNAPSMVVALAALVVPCLVIAVRGSGFGRVAYSPRWYRDPSSITSSTPGWVALAVTLGCAAGLALLYRWRSADHLPKRPSTQLSASA